ncbi:transcription factor TFIIIC subunit tfc4 [Tulasnella sp. 419]|nr:transcription factor TFIIIC subunit tfc4 [Tulasnella sp. 419]
MDFPNTESEGSDEFEEEVDPTNWEEFSVASDDASDYLPEEIEDVSNVFDEEQLKEAQGEIEGDFDRIVENIKQSNVASTEGGPVPWTFSIEEGEEFDYEEEARERSGIGRRKGKKRGPRREVELSHQVRAMLGEASAAFVNQDLAKTMEICQEVIRIEPAAYAAWNTLALVHEEQGQPESALKLKIMAAHLQGDAELWRDLGRQSRAGGQMQQALYCFRKAVSLDPHDVDALWDRSVILKENNMDRAAMNGFMAILKLVPFHLGVLQQLGPLFSILSEFQKGIKLYQEALAYFQQLYPDGPSDFEAPDYVILIITLADFCNTVGEHELAIRAVRDGARWLQGRADQKYWVTAADDREFDPEGHVRNTNATEESSSRIQSSYILETNLRHRLAIARLSLGDVEEGQLHASLVLANDTLEYASLFLEIASAYFERGLYEQALRVYEELAGYDEISTVDILLQIGACHHHLDDLEKSIEVMQYILQVDPVNNDAKMRLAELYEMMNQPKKALQLVNEGTFCTEILLDGMFIGQQ